HKRLQHGAGGVLVSGRHPGDRHYISGNYHARRRFALLKNLLEFVGVEPGRVSFSWVSAAEGEKFKEINEAYQVLGDEHKRRQYDYLIALTQNRQKFVTEDAFGVSVGQSVDKEALQQLLRRLAALGLGSSSVGWVICEDVSVDTVGAVAGGNQP
ncbi:MAG: hydrogenase iron-sulfur subunit, partial [Chloroflexi bacterium]|nr:hydrogenase iron-sulfur subunit [Chloroflexota bacterium]